MPTATRTFRVFVSSTFEDLKAERDALQREVFPKLRTLCEQHSARFQAIDLRWGIRDEAAADQRTMEICLTEIERCQRTGIKPNFIVLLGQRYGWRPLPSRVEAQEFDAVWEHIAGAKDRELVESWYRRDDNAVPAEYVLKPRAGEWAQSERWQALEAHLHGTLLKAAQAADLSQERRVKFEASSTHQEILKGLGATPEDRRRVFAFCRNVSDNDCDPDLVTLKKVLHERLPADNILNYELGDFAKLCREVERTLREVIASEAAGFESRPALALEIEAHDAFARERALVFGREDALEGIARYIREGGARPLALHGPSGSGKSAVMAQSSERAKSELAGAVVLRRFIGASPESSNGLTLLRSLCEQVGEAYGIPGNLPVDFNGIARAFHKRLSAATESRPIAIFLDAPDQLGKDDPARMLTWLGGAIPAHCRVVVSSTELAPMLDVCAVVELGPLPGTDASNALDFWFHDARRRLTPAQRERLLAAFTCYGLPLYLKLAFEEARGWASYQAADECPLGEGVEGVIDSLLNRLSREANHGPLLVNRSLSYLAAARYGLAEDEMVDILSADEPVWQDFECRAHHTPPDRRLPVIVWSRLFFDLEPYLTERAAPGGTVMTFYHRQILGRVATRFLADNERQLRHKELSEYFAGQSNWLDEGNSVPNLRRVTEMVSHRVSAEMLEEAEATLTELDFLSAKCAAGLVSDLQGDYRSAIAALAEARAELGEDARRRAEAARWTKEIIEYSRQWTTGEGRPPLPKPIRSVRLWSNQDIEAERRRIVENPTRFDRLRMFAGFVEQECYPLLEFGARPGFVVQHAFNHAAKGLVHEAAARAMVAVTAPLLTRSWSAGDLYNPKPALLRTLEGHTNYVTSVSVTPDDQRAVSGSDDGTVRVWDLETGACLLEARTGWVTSVSVTPDGRRAVSGNDDRTLRVWDLETGSCLRVLQGHTERIHSVSVTPDGRRAVSGSDDRTVRVWDLETGACLRVLEGHTGWVSSVSVTPDGRRAVSGSGDSGVYVWDLETGASLRVLKGHVSVVESTTVTPDSRRAVSGGWDGTVRVWDLETGACSRVLQGHTGFVHSVSVTPDGRRAVSASSDQTVRVWDLETGACLRVLEGHTDDVHSVSVTPDNRRAVSGGYDHTVRLWDLEAGSCLGELEGHTEWVASVSVASDSQRAVSASADRTMRLWDLETGATLRVLEGHTDDVHSVSVTPDGRRAVSASRDCTVRLWNLETGVCLRVLEGHTNYVRCVSVTPDSRRAVSGSDDKTVRVWDLETGACLWVLEGHTGWVSSVSVTPDGRRAVSGSYDYTLRVWDLKTGACVRVLEGYLDWVSSVSVTPDSQRAVSGGWDGTVRVWDLETGSCLRVLEGHTASVNSVSVTPDGLCAVSASRDKTVRLWDLDTGTCLAIVRLSAPVEAVALSPTPGRVIAGTSAGEVLRFALHGMTWSCKGPRAAGSGPEDPGRRCRREAGSLLRRMRAAWERLSP